MLCICIMPLFILNKDVLLLHQLARHFCGCDASLSLIYRWNIVCDSGLHKMRITKGAISDEKRGRIQRIFFARRCRDTGKQPRQEWAGSVTTVFGSSEKGLCRGIKINEPYT